MVDLSSRESHSRLWFWASVILLFAVFTAYGTMRAPIPGANEPNYLSKARNFWDPAWCARDIYLQSGNSHWVFYVTCGGLTRVLSFEQTAWVGRLIVWFLLAAGWVRMTDPLFPGGGRRGGSLLSAVLFLAWSAFTHTNFAGEWVIGGVEGKGFAYAGLWLGIGALLQGRLREAAIWTGLGVSFHPVVGVWSLLGTGIAVVTFSWRDFWNPVRSSSNSLAPAAGERAEVRGEPLDPPTQEDVRPHPAFGHPLPQSGRGFEEASPWPPGIKVWIVPTVLLVLTSLPGIIPALAVLAENPGPELAKQADDIQIFVRLKHHLDPTTFSNFAYQSYAVLLTIWLILLKPTTHSASQRWFVRYVATSIVIALGGLALGWLVLAAREYQVQWFLPASRFLKFYLFREADLLLPMSVAIQLATVLLPIGLVAKRTERREGTENVGMAESAGMKWWRSPRTRTVLCVIIGPVAFAYALLKPGPAPAPAVASLVTPQFMADWYSVCAWVRENTPRDSLFLIPRFNRNFKWYAERAEYHSWKDCPQDAAGILEWNRRRLWLDDWGGRHFIGDRGTRADLQDLAKRTEPDRAEYCILYSRLTVDQQQPVYRNGSFAVYSLAKANPETPK